MVSRVLSCLVALSVFAAPAAAVAQQRVQLKRMAVRLIDPDDYRTTLTLEPITLLDLVAPADGYLRAVEKQAGDKVNRQAEVARMENSEAQFVLERAKALRKVAEIQLEIAKEAGKTRGIELAQAQVEAAVADEELAKLRFERASIRSPIEGVVFVGHVGEGRFLRAGDKIVTVGDTTRLRVEIPMDRAGAEVGKELDIKVADKTVKARIDRVQPLSPRFDKIRDIVTDAVSAVVVVDNTEGNYEIGQTVFTPLVPTNPLCVVPNSAIGSLPDEKGRKVQVIREDVVRDIPIVVMAGIGEDTSYISGALAETDELITSSSIVLEDGIEVRRAAAPAKAGAPRRGNDDDD